MTVIVSTLAAIVATAVVIYIVDLQYLFFLFRNIRSAALPATKLGAIPQRRGRAGLPGSRTTARPALPDRACLPWPLHAAPTSGRHWV